MAALRLMGRLDDTFSPIEQEKLVKWCLFRQQTGFQGRPNKPVDTCYSFWVGATLEVCRASVLVLVGRGVSLELVWCGLVGGTRQE